MALLAITDARFARREPVGDLMTKDRFYSGRFRCRALAGVLAALAMALGLGSGAAGCAAAELLAPARPPNLPAVLASVTVLSDAAMANETGAGLRSSAVIDDATGHAKVMLWDELRGPPQIVPTNNATLTVTGGGPGK